MLRSLRVTGHVYSDCESETLTVVEDDAVGSILVREAYGVIGDERGKRLAFGLRRTLGENYDIVTTTRTYTRSRLSPSCRSREGRGVEPIVGVGYCVPSDV